MKGGKATKPREELKVGRETMRCVSNYANDSEIYF
jgi:hypothetical protein